MSMLNLRANLLAIYGEPHDIIMQVKTDSTEWQIKISPSMLDLIAAHIVEVKKKLQEPA